MPEELPSAPRRAMAKQEAEDAAELKAAVAARQSVGPLRQKYERPWDQVRLRRSAPPRSRSGPRRPSPRPNPSAALGDERGVDRAQQHCGSAPHMAKAMDKLVAARAKIFIGVTLASIESEEDDEEDSSARTRTPGAALRHGVTLD